MKVRSENPLRLTQIKKAFDEPVLDGIDLTLAWGEFVVLVGPNACGKTTLLRIIARLLNEDVGTVDVSDRPEQNGDAWLSMVFQKSLLLPWLTVEENICLPLRISKHLTEDASSLDRLLDMLGLQNKRKAYPKGLSGGEAQKVAIARALATKPHILLLDEPFSALDDGMRDTLQTALLKIWSETAETILFVTHDLDEAVLLADRIVVLSQKPSSVKEKISIPLARPRNRNSTEFEELVLSVRRALLS